jgi:acetylornithine deacetylase/succinyl-diaminopimelate desuccinylase-like protein
MPGLLVATLLFISQTSDLPDPPARVTIRGEVAEEADGRGGTLGFLLLEHLDKGGMRAYRVVIADVGQASVLHYRVGLDVAIVGLRGERASMPYLFAESITPERAK